MPHNHASRYRWLLLLLLVPFGLLVLWGLSGRTADLQVLDYVRAYHNPAAGEILIVAAFDAGSFGVLDSCHHEFLPSSGELRVELRSKWFLSRDGRSMRLAAFRIPWPAGRAALATLRLRSSATPAGDTITIEPLPPGFTPLTQLIDSRGR